MLFCFSSWNGLRHPPNSNASVALELQTLVPDVAGEAQKREPCPSPRLLDPPCPLLSEPQPLLCSLWLPGNQLWKGGRWGGRKGGKKEVDCNFA